MESKNKETLRLNGFPSASFPGTPGETGDAGISYLFSVNDKNNTVEISIENTETSLYFKVPKNDIKENDYVIYRNETVNKIEFRKIKKTGNNLFVTETAEFSFPMLKN